MSGVFSFTIISSINQNISSINNNLSIMAQFKTICDTLYKNTYKHPSKIKHTYKELKMHCKAMSRCHTFTPFQLTFFHGGSKIVFRMAFSCILFTRHSLL